MKTRFLLVTLWIPIIVFGQPPAGYYQSATNKNGEELKIALHHIIKNHDAQSYNYVWTAFKTTDKKPNGNVWDIYSDNPGGVPPYEYQFGVDQCGNYSAENDCYNREHSWPQSYFNSQMPMRTDLYALYPTDGFVNAKRSNYAYGVVSSPSPWVSLNGSKLGASDVSLGNNGDIVFEPIDEYKGDLARTYFYMSTRYWSEDGQWSNWSMANGANLKPWAAAMLLEWSKNDPVSQKEIDRNNAIYAIQNNRNPFIDHPEFADCIWGTADCSTTHIFESEASGLLTVFPNPARDQVHIRWTSSQASSTWSLQLLNLQGQVLHAQSMTTSHEVQTTIQIQDFAPGLYWIRIQNDQTTFVRKLLIQ